MHTLAISYPHLHYPVMAPITELWQRLRQARRFADMTQQDLADKVGVSRGAVALWEAAEPEHRTKPTTEHVVKIASVTRAPLEWLLNDASDLNAIWRLTSEFGDPGRALSAPSAAAPPTSPPPDVLPDLEQHGHLFVFASVPEHLHTKLQRLAQHADPAKAHLILVGSAAANLHAVASPTDALARVVEILRT